MEEDDRVTSLLAETDALISVKRFAEAGERAKEAAELAASDPRPWCQWSRALYGEGRFAQAAQMADQAIRLAPELATSHRLRSTALCTLARRSNAADRARLGRASAVSAREAVRLAPWDPNGFVALAQALPLTGEILEADTAAREAIRLAPHSASTWIAASLVAMEAKNWSAAVNASRRALAREPDNYAALNNLGVALRASGKGREGTAVLARAARANPDSPTARRNLSRAGLNVVRVGIMILLLPLVLVTRFGFVIYLVFAIGSNMAISRNPELVLRLERWAAPVALFFAKRPGRRTDSDPVAFDEPPPPDCGSADAGPQWSAVVGRHPIGTPVVLFGAVIAWTVAVIALVGLLAPGSSALGIVAALLVSTGIAVWLTAVVVRRRRAIR